MSAWWFAGILVAGGYFLLAHRHAGFRAQPVLARARTAGRFREVVETAGGRGAVTAGVVVDLGFIVLFGAVAVWLLAGSDGPWWLALVPAVLDLAQDLLLVLATRGSPTAGGLRMLTVVTLTMYAAYAATLVTLAVALVRSL